jgi:uncharacterized protein with PIN domain
MEKRCAICNTKIIEKDNKINGTIIYVKDEKSKKQEIYVCFECMKSPDYIETAIIKDA